MDNLDFSEEEIQQQLAILGYKNIPKHRLLEFKQDLDKLICHGQWKNLASTTPVNRTSQSAASQSSPPAYTKEKVSLLYSKGSGEGFFINEKKAFQDTERNKPSGWPQRRCDSYAERSVGAWLKLPAAAPTRLQEEPDTEDALDSLLADSYTSLSDHQQRPFIKRKVLRKRKGKSLICDESVYTEDSAHAATMYKMYNDQEDEGSDDEKNSLYSSFWSDGEVADKDEEVEIMRVMDPGAVGEPHGSPPGTSPEEHPELKGQGMFNGETLEEGSNDRKTTSSSSGSLAVSPMTSGYGTFRAEEQELADHRDDHSLTGLKQDSRDDLSGFRDDEEYPGAPRGFTEFDNEPRRERDESESAVCGSEASRVPAASSCCEDNSTLSQISTADTRPPVGTRLPSEVQHLHSDAGDMLLFHRKGVQGGGDENRDGKQETLQHDVERNTEQVVVVGVPDESSSNKDVRFIDSNRDFSWKTNEKMSEEREEILTWMKDAASRLEERMAELDLSTSDQKDYEAESEDLTESDAQSSETEGVNLSAFESYIQRMTQTDRDVRPKPKSFIRPVMCQPTIKKTDPVARYFQYKQMWEMFQVSGEKDRKALRWEIREKLAYQPLPPKPRRVYVPNTYIVPTEKKRSELRWMIRNDLANGHLPQKFNSHF